MKYKFSKLTHCVSKQQNQSSTHSHTQPEGIAEKSSDKRSIISNNSAVVSSSKLMLPSAHPPTSTGCPAKVFSSVGSACSTASAAKEAMYSHQASASVSGPSKSSWSCRDQIQNTTSSKWQLYFFEFHNEAKNIWIHILACYL